MRFVPTSLAGVTIVELEPREDDRGYFARAFCAREFADHGLNPTVAQTNISFNRSAGTLRGLHYQAPPAQEAKLIRCIGGAAFFAVVDLRDGDTHLAHATTELVRGDRRSLYVPEGCAVGMQTLADDTELIYQVSEFYTPETEGGIRHDDPAIGISWPRAVTEISEKDTAWPLLSGRADS